MSSPGTRSAELKAMSEWLDGHRALLGLVAEDLRRDGVRATGPRCADRDAALGFAPFDAGEAAGRVVNRGHLFPERHARGRQARRRSPRGGGRLRMLEIRRPKKPYEEHRREFAAARGLETNQDVKETGAESPAEKTSMEANVAASAPAPPEAVSKQRRAGLPQEEKLRLKFTVHAPMPGASAWFDRAVAHMGDEKALPRVLTKAFDESRGRGSGRRGHRARKLARSIPPGARIPLGISRRRSSRAARARSIRWSCSRPVHSGGSWRWPRWGGCSDEQPNDSHGSYCGLYSRSSDSTAYSRSSTHKGVLRVARE